MSAGETKASVSAWTIDSLHEHFGKILAALDRRFDERVDDIKDAAKEADVRYQQRYEASQLALRDALSAAEKATFAALTAAKEAVVKAEIAGEKRFDAMNEFRGQLKDQAQTFPTKPEVDARITSLTEKLDAIILRHGELENKLIAALAQAAGRNTGVGQAWGVLVAVVGIIVAVISVALSLAR